MTEHAGEGPKASSRTWLGIALAAIASAAALVANLDTLQKWWCQHIGYSCTFQLSSETVRVTSGGGDADVCKTHTSTVCIRPSSPARQLVKGAKFAVTNKSSGVFIDGIPDDAHKSNPINTSNMGWLHQTDKQDEFCVLVYARTSACETPVFIEGLVRGSEANK